MASTAVRLPAPLSRKVVRVNKRLLDRTRSGDASRVLTMPVRHVGFDALRGHTHMLLVTYRRDGTPVPTPVWFGQDDERLYVWTEEHAYKAKRLRRQGRALVAPSTARGAPTGEPIAALGRVIDDPAERARAVSAIQGSWGPLRRLFERASRPFSDATYIELVPDRPTRLGSEP